MERLRETLHDHLQHGTVIPAHPLALTVQRTLDEKHQRALTRYYVASGAGGIAVGVHTTQFEIREHGLLQLVLEMAAETVAEARRGLRPPFLLVAGICGEREQALREAKLARDLGYHLGLLRMPTNSSLSETDLLEHAQLVGEVIPIFGFYLQPAIGGRVLSYRFWRQFVEIPAVAAIKVAPFNRYRTLDVMRALWDSGRRQEIALYTGNDDHILADLVTEAAFGEGAPLHFVGGLLGQWAVWTETAVAMLQSIQRERAAGTLDTGRWLAEGARLTDANAAIFDAEHAFRGCIPGIHEVLRRQGLVQGRWCLDPALELSLGQGEAIERVSQAYPELNDDSFVALHRDTWLQ